MRLRGPLIAIGLGMGLAVVPTAGAWAAAPAAVVPTTSAVSFVAGVDLQAVACPSASMCVAVGTTSYPNAGVVVTITNGTPGTPQYVPAALRLTGVACPSITTCEAVGYQADTSGVVLTVTNGTAGIAQVPAALHYIGLNAVACPTISTCEAVGSASGTSGAVVTITNGVSGAAQIVSERLSSVACPSTTTCEAVGSIYGEQNIGADTSPGQVGVVTIANGVAGAEQLTSGYLNIVGLACSTATTCVAVGDYWFSDYGTFYPSDQSTAVVVPITDGVQGPAQLVPGIDKLLGVACPSAVTCEAVGYDAPHDETDGHTAGKGVIVPITAGMPSAAEDVTGPLASWDYPTLAGVACQSVTACEAVGRLSPSNTRTPSGLTAAISLGTPTPAPPSVPIFMNPTNGQTGVDTTQRFEWSGIPAAQGYDLTIGTVPGGADLFDSGFIAAPKTVSPVPVMPVGRTIFATVFDQVNGAWSSASITFTVAPSQASLTFPTPDVPGQPGLDPTAPFTWTTIPQAQGYFLIVGTSQYGADVVSSGVMPPAQLSYVTPTLPPNTVLYATLFTKVNGGWTRLHAVTFTTGPLGAVLTQPFNGVTNMITPAWFQWTSRSAAQNYYLIIGTTRFGNNIFISGLLLAYNACMVSALPHGTFAYASLFTKVNGTWTVQEAGFTTG